MADLIDRDAVLHDVLTECSNAHEAKYYEAQVALTRAKRIICDAPAVNRWIPCSERLPEQSEYGQPPGVRCSDCVMITDRVLIHMAYCVNDEWQYADCGQVSDFVEYTVTHWMPLPKPPKE